jgi:hypothetical protein
MKKYILFGILILVVMVVSGCSVSEINPRPQDYIPN